MFRELTWDSNFFHKKVGELTLDNGHVETFPKVDLLYVKSKNETIPEIKGYHCRYAENKVVYTKELTDSGARHEKIHSISKKPYQVEDLYQLAYITGKFSRFNLDPNIPEADFTRLYRTWIDKSISGENATDLFIYVDQEETAGFISYQQEKGYAMATLAGVSPAQQGKKIGKALFKHLEQVVFDQGQRELRIPTQAVNQHACTFYEKLGYTILESTSIKHYYRDDSL
ncbi:GNAT family N-acetyltransferase [Pedobacter sp.]|uniref:GNAT family N-acetyltransferase n=1 Tax=Pedobacter sp. TaxID=1411316 RepID=UPI003D7F306D